MKCPQLPGPSKRQILNTSRSSEATEAQETRAVGPLPAVTILASGLRVAPGAGDSSCVAAARPRASHPGAAAPPNARSPTPPAGAAIMMAPWPRGSVTVTGTGTAGWRGWGVGCSLCLSETRIEPLTMCAFGTLVTAWCVGTGMGIGGSVP
jgi:hypothetical protein